VQDMDKVWNKIDGLEESRIRHDERMNRMQAERESDRKETNRHLAKLETSFEEIRTEVRQGFHLIGQRLNETEATKHKKVGYEQGVKETRVGMLKQFGLWLSIAALLLSFLFWRLS